MLMPIPRASRFLIAALFAVLASNLPALCRAQDTAPITKGQRVFTCAHSFHGFVYGMLAEAAKNSGIEDHACVGLSGIGGSRVIQHSNASDEKHQAKVALSEGKVDVLTLSPIWVPDEGIEKFAKLGLEHNPNIRITVQEFWLPNDTYEPKYPLDVRKTPKVVNWSDAGGRSWRGKLVEVHNRAETGRGEYWRAVTWGKARFLP